MDVEYSITSGDGSVVFGLWEHAAFAYSSYSEAPPIPWIDVASLPTCSVSSAACECLKLESVSAVAEHASADV